jgi:hypothetical protein
MFLLLILKNIFYKYVLLQVILSMKYQIIETLQIR